jgi:DNA-binding transcriptional LysR family regulator
VARLMIFVQHPRHVSTEEAESWLAKEFEALVGNGVERVYLSRLRNPSLRFGETWAWMFELECRDADAACEAVRHGAGLALLADLRLLGMWPSVALVDDIH